MNNMTTCGTEHGRLCEKVDELRSIWPCLKEKLPIYVFKWAVIICFCGFSALAGWIGYVQGVSAAERKDIVVEYRNKNDKLVDAINSLKIEIVSLRTTLGFWGQDK